VIHAIGCGPLVRMAHLAHALHGLPPRVLVRTYARAPLDRFDDALPPSRRHRRTPGRRRRALIGIDTASIDPADSKDCPATR
jgi:arylformamidase